jgi:membrane protein YdbS with pleckstrin-like domain
MLKDRLIKFFKLDSMANNLTGYLEARMELLKIEIKEDVARGVSKAVVFVVLAFAFCLFIFFISVGAAYWIGESLGVPAGFAIISAVYLLIAIVLYVKREEISHKIEKQVLEITKKSK